ncbi:beta-phosphoglucomutase [Niallia circulans]|jgi:beta-phosphoglucomutase|uniref:beta-phosphoglucomutase n=1 Tax=Niallia TaxID=2837506 RepID=UPI000BA6BA6F|nr:beta-phosphoglucomutase [Niallia circulans]PAD24118.1 beta-phosphoglucomutase [Niallia circulans]PAD87547.1 beta-phosphoglucomutase [Niallia circulans]
MTNRLQAVIFDFDGVIADTVPLYYEATKKMALEIGVSFTREDNLRYQGVPRKVLIDDLVAQTDKVFTDKEKEILGNRKSDYYKALIAEFTVENMLPGMYEFLKELREMGIKFGIASSSSNAPFLLERFGIRDWFDCIVDPHSLKKGKPDPEIFLTAADCLGIDYHECAAIEDGQAGLSGILQTPMFSVGIGQGDVFAKADWQVASTRELSAKTLLEKFNNR